MLYNQLRKRTISTIISESRDGLGFFLVPWQCVLVRVHVVAVLPVHVAPGTVIGHHDYPAGPAARSADAQLSGVGPHELRERACEKNE